MPVYVLRAGDTGMVKIGFTGGALRKRLTKLQSDNHERLVVLRWLHGDKETERSLHSKYAARHIRGDWFDFCETMLGDLGVPDIRSEPPRVIDPVQAVADHGVAGLITIAGGPHALGVKLGVSRTTVAGWKLVGRVPAKRAVQISQVMRLPLAEVLKIASQVAA